VGNQNEFIAIRFDPPLIRSAAMRLPVVHSPLVSHSASWGPTWICIGLGTLIANACWVAVPAVTAMAIVALGATMVTLERFRGASGAYLVVAMNLVTYCGLYALFLGATLHGVEVHVGRLGALTAIDLVASAWPISAVFAKSWQALRRCEPAA
jgi:hypothetical protein